jgi:processive 1,2-diacylglycerol beta-glucosyltransferase
MSEPKRRVLFVTAPFGLAPKRALEAVSAAMSAEFPDVEARTVDVFDYVNAAARAVLLKGYESLVATAPSLWGFLYEKESLVESLSPNENFARSVQWDALRALVAEFPPSVVVVSHPFAAAPFLRLKREGHLEVPVVSVLTDFHVHNVLVQDGISLYTTADAKLTEQLAKRGVERELIYACGVPVADRYTRAHDLSALRAKYGLEEGRKVLLVIGQSFDPDLADRMLFQFSLLKTPTQILLTAGNNAELADRFRRFAAIYGVRAKLFGEVEAMHELMAVSDLAVTHGGALTTAECLATGLPLVLLEPVPGQETRNTRFLADQGVARQAAGVLSLGAEVDFALGDGSVYSRMKQAALELGKKSASRDTGRAIYLAAQNATQIVARERERAAKSRTDAAGGIAGASSSGTGGTGTAARPLFEEIGTEQASAEVPRNLTRGAAHDLLVGWIMSEKDAKRRHETAMDEASRWQRRAELAVREGQEDLAKEALRRAEEARREAVGLEQELRRIAAEKAKVTGRAAGAAPTQPSNSYDPTQAEMESRFRKMELDDELKRLKHKLDEGGSGNR